MLLTYIVNSAILVSMMKRESEKMSSKEEKAVNKFIREARILIDSARVAVHDNSDKNIRQTIINISKEMWELKAKLFKDISPKSLIDHDFTQSDFCPLCVLFCDDKDGSCDANCPLACEYESEHIGTYHACCGEWLSWKRAVNKYAYGKGKDMVDVDGEVQVAFNKLKAKIDAIVE